jgi:Dolichyl-phosphate-mannose-protein mannosyltransferase
MPTPSTEISRSRAETTATARTTVWRRPGLCRTAALAGITLLLLVGSVLRADAIGSNVRVSSDEQGNVANTNAILLHKRYPTFRWAPGTPFVFAVVTRLRGYHSLRAAAHSHGPAQYAQLAIEIATLALIALIAWVIAGQWAALLAVALAALYLPLILVTRTYLSEPFGGLMILLTFAAAAWARQRGWRALAAAGVLAGLGCLTREDLFPGVVVIAVAIMWPLWRASRRRAISCGAVYLACAVVVITPWVIYASGRVGRFVPITDGGPDAFFIGSYLPGGGEQYPDVESFRSQICRHYPADCHHLVSRGTADMFKLVTARYPGLAEDAAITKADLDNLRRYALGQPLAFAGMLANKTWRLWSYPWSGGNGYGQHPKADTSRVQHLIFTGLALLGLLGGAVVTRRWSLFTVTFGLGAITLLNILVNAQGRDNVR